MDVTLSLSREIQENLAARAERQGVSLDYLLRDLVAREAGIFPSALPAGSISGEEKARAFVLWAKSHRPTPPLADEAVDRSSMYPDRL